MNAFAEAAVKPASAATNPVQKMNSLRLPNDRWSPLEVAFWLLPVAAYFAFPGYLVLISQIMIIGLFALSLDLMLGYAGIVSLGHAAFFGLGAYTAGLLSVHGWSEPLSGLLAGAVVAGLFGFVVSFLVAYGSVVWFMAWVRQRGFAPFAVYRIILGAAVLVLASRMGG